MRIGILGGTFDPIHNAHLFIAEDARTRLQLDHVYVIPNGTPPHKQRCPITSAGHRLRMAELAVGRDAHLTVDPIEAERSGPSFTVDTLRAYRKRCPATEIVFLTGADAVAEIGTWREPDEVLRLCRMVAVSRPGFDMERMLRLAPHELMRDIETLEVAEIGISSTLIRARVSQGLPIRGLTPDPVIRYIELHGLYRD